MGIFNRRKFHKDEDSLVTSLFGEISENDMINLFPEISIAIDKKHNDLVKQILLEKTNDSESRKKIIAWNKLRDFSVTPDESVAKKILGFIIEVGMKKGVDYLAVYLDNSARYFNFSGAKVIYEGCDELINIELQKLLLYCQQVVNQIGVWEQARRDPPSKGIARINFLTPKGLHFGEAPLNILEQDILAKDVIAQSIVVMKLLTDYKS